MGAGRDCAEAAGESSICQGAMGPADLEKSWYLLLPQGAVEHLPWDGEKALLTCSFIAHPTASSALPCCGEPSGGGFITTPAPRAAPLGGDRTHRQCRCRWDQGHGTALNKLLRLIQCLCSQVWFLLARGCGTRAQLLLGGSWCTGRLYPSCFW